MSGTPPITVTPVRHEIASALRGSDLREVVDELMQSGLLRLVSDAEVAVVPGFFSKPFTIPRPGKRARMVVDARRLNEHLCPTPFKLP